MVEDSGSRRSKTEGLPSWAPDWTIPNATYRMNTRNSILCASKGRDFQFSLAALAKPELGMMFKGCVIDTMEDVSHYLPPRRFSDKYSASGNNSIFFSYWFDFAEEKGQRKYRRDKERY